MSDDRIADIQVKVSDHVEHPMGCKCDLCFMYLDHARLESELAETLRLNERQAEGLDAYERRLDAEKARRAEAETALHKRAWPVLECPDCDGAGTTGTAPNGKKYSCETCGGNEDSAGRGWIKSMDMDTATARADALAKVAGEVAGEMERSAEQRYTRRTRRGRDCPNV